MTEKELVAMLREQVELEEKNVNSLNKTVAKTRNVVIKQLLHGIALDSAKHSDILKAVIDLLSVATAISEVERDELHEELKKHVENENYMLHRIEKIAEKAEHKGVKFLLQYILSDERRHHETLNEIMEHVVSRETITEEEWWDFLYRDAVAHGAPVG